MKQIAFLISLLVLGAASASAQNETADSDVGPSRVFGEAGQFAISSDASLEIRHSSNEVTSIGIGPAADFFVIENLSIGGVIALKYDQTGDSSVTRFGIGPRVGYNIPFSESFGLWPRLGFSYSHVTASAETETVGGSILDVSSSSDNFTINLFAPLMYHPVEHFFVGFGPFLDADIAGDNKITTFGAKLLMGGWFDT